MTSDDWLRLFWLPLAVTILGGLALAGILAIFYTPVREKFWKPIGRGIRWLTTLRPTTTKREAVKADEMAALRQEVSKGELGLERAHASLRDQEAEFTARLRAADADAQAEIEAVKSLAAQEIADERRKALARGRREGKAEALAEVAAERSKPRVRPSWALVKAQDAGTYILKNNEPDAVVSDVALAVNPQYFVFTGSSRWPGTFAGIVSFEGAPLKLGRMMGVEFAIHYRDVLGDEQSDTAWVDKEPPRAYSL